VTSRELHLKEQFQQQVMETQCHTLHHIIY
jgi:hypothetical protein